MAADTAAPAEARALVRRSIELFDALSAAQWSKRTRQERRAAGETIGRRTHDARDRVTVQELHIAQLAADLTGGASSWLSAEADPAVPKLRPTAR
jgi:hypothetical protein